MSQLRIIKERLFNRWLLTFFHSLVVAVRAYKNAVFLVESSPLFSGNFLYRNPLIFFVVGIHLLAASIAPNNRRVALGIGTLTEISVLDRMVIKMSRHPVSTPYTGWLPSKCNPNDTCYIVDGNWSGLLINYRPYSLPPLPFHALDLRRNITLSISRDFRQTQILVEEYYTGKASVNSNRTVP
jgi:hypothetical protein